MVARIDRPSPVLDDMEHTRPDPRESKVVNIYYCPRFGLETESRPVAE